MVVFESLNVKQKQSQKMAWTWFGKLGAGGLKLDQDFKSFRMELNKWELTWKCVELPAP